MVDAGKRNLEVWAALSAYKQHQTILRLGDHDYMRSLRVEDVTSAYVNGLNNPDVNRHLVGPKKQHQTMDVVREYVRSNWVAKDSILFGLFIDGILAGTSRLHDATSDCAYIGIALFNKDIWGRGWGSRVIENIARYAIADLNISCVRAGIDSTNAASLRVFSKAGFHHLSEMDESGGNSLTQKWEFDAYGK